MRYINYIKYQILIYSIKRDTRQIFWISTVRYAEGLPEYRRSPQITADHHRSPQITADDHRRSTQITTDHQIAYF